MTVAAEWIEELGELVRIPSVSADPTHAADLVAAARWIEGFVRRAGGTAALVHGSSPPIVRGCVPASPELELQAPPTVVLYGHYDVQPPGRLVEWETPPFEPQVRGGWLYEQMLRCRWQGWRELVEDIVQAF